MTAHLPWNSSNPDQPDDHHGHTRTLIDFLIVQFLVDLTIPSSVDLVSNFAIKYFISSASTVVVSNDLVDAAPTYFLSSNERGPTLR